MKIHRNFKYIIYVSAVILLFSRCEKDIEVVLPPHDNQMVVECYLQDGQPAKLTLTESVGYFSEPQFPQINDAEIIISSDGQTLPLKYEFYRDPASGKYYNYVANEPVSLEPDKTYTILVRNQQGREVTGATKVLPMVPIKSFDISFNRFEEASITLRFDDNKEQQNFYRVQVMRDSSDVLVPEFAYAFSDTFDDGEVLLSTGFMFNKGDEVIINLYHIEKQYYDFLRSVEDAISSNGNPFGQPSRLKSSLNGGFGIFTVLIYDSKRILIE